MPFTRGYMSYQPTAHPPFVENQSWGKHSNTLSEQLVKYTFEQTPPVYVEPRYNEYTTPLLPAMADKPALTLSLTTLTCYRSPVALWVCNTLAQHYIVSETILMAIRIATHEAIANAIIHGNLGIQEHYNGIKAFNTYHARIVSLLDDPEYALRRIILILFYTGKEITIRISDEGNGYTELPARYLGEELPLGKGLSLIRTHSSAVRILEGGRTIEMDFIL